jgi:hypothetical protein
MILYYYYLVQNIKNLLNHPHAYIEMNMYMLRYFLYFL